MMDAPDGDETRDQREPSIIDDDDLLALASVIAARDKGTLEILRQAEKQ